jgi:hypothetical protein
VRLLGAPPPAAAGTEPKVEAIVPAPTAPQEAEAK